ncbi:hypothetical protein FGG08_003638 [Glutinoglossum americanum]|uniref:Uncharacterized protein n=1 Tax=Glutinoglossum americanum TaxID=1670608 RepID=A0A9P8I3X3_9PEZI|nr:hypothetical protein FGG08_003638 [Glutinoglossum americanum]
MDFTIQEIEKIKSDMGRLIAALEAHSGMTSNPVEKAIFFTWDFVNRTLSMVNSLDPTKHDAQTKELFSDIIGRNTLAKLLINDTTGKTAVMMGRDPQDPVDFGAEVISAANEL